MSHLLSRAILCTPHGSSLGRWFWATRPPPPREGADDNGGGGDGGGGSDGESDGEQLIGRGSGCESGWTPDVVVWYLGENDVPLMDFDDDDDEHEDVDGDPEHRQHREHHHGGGGDGVRLERVGGVAAAGVAEDGVAGDGEAARDSKEETGGTEEEEDDDDGGDDGDDEEGDEDDDDVTLFVDCYRHMLAIVRDAHGPAVPFLHLYDTSTAEGEQVGAWLPACTAGDPNSHISPVTLPKGAENTFSGVLFHRNAAEHATVARGVEGLVRRLAGWHGPAPDAR